MAKEEVEKPMYVIKHVNNYVRHHLNMGVRNDLHPKLQKKIQELLEDGKDRAVMDKRKTIMAKDL